MCALRMTGDIRMVPRTLENLENLEITWNLKYDLENLEITWNFVL